MQSLPIATLLLGDDVELAQCPFTGKVQLKPKLIMFGVFFNIINIVLKNDKRIQKQIILEKPKNGITTFVGQTVHELGLKK